MRKTYYVYILANRRNGTLYIGITSDLIKRIYQHKNKIYDGFTSKYNVSKLVYYESGLDVLSVIGREKKLKRYSREDKFKLIESTNPEWNDLYYEIIGVDD